MKQIAGTKTQTNAKITKTDLNVTTLVVLCNVRYSLQFQFLETSPILLQKECVHDSREHFTLFGILNFSNF